MRNKQWFFLGLATLLLMASCNGNKENTGSNTTTSPSSTTETKSASTDQSGAKANINVTINGGDMNGSYSATCKEDCCSWGIAGANTFGTQYSENDKGAKELSSVQLIVDDVKDKKSTKEFTVTVTFGKLFGEGSKSFNINTREGKTDGSGTVDVDYSGNKATVTIKGVSKEGPAIDLKMTCNNVVTASNMGQ